MYVNFKLSPVQLRFRFAPDGFLWFHLYITVIIVINEASSSRADSEIKGNPYSTNIFAGSVSASMVSGSTIRFRSNFTTFHCYGFDTVVHVNIQF